MPQPRLRTLGIVVHLALLMVACSSSSLGKTAPTAGESAPPVPDFELPEANAEFDYQLSGASAPPAGVAVVVRDRTAAPAPGLYNICYVNGFQTQPAEAEFWLEEHPDLLLRDADGARLVDPEWPDEFILDPTTADKRERLGTIVGGWIEGCAEAGFQAVEIDNLDTFARFPEAISQDDAVDYARTLVDRSHAAGLAFAQKNAAELLDRREEMLLDFAVVEQCNEFEECDDFAEVYGGHVFMIEYDPDAFEAGCARHPERPILLRDVELSQPESDTYLRRSCPRGADVTHVEQGHGD